MPGARPRLTRRLILDLAERIKAGAYEQVAAESLGVPFALYQDWLARGRGPRAGVLYRDLVREVRRARAHARFMAEMDVRTQAPKVWLLNGPGKETDELPGWSSLAKPRAETERQLNVLEHPEVVALLNAIREALRPFPEARAAVLKAITEMATSGTK